MLAMVARTFQPEELTAGRVEPLNMPQFIDQDDAVGGCAQRIQEHQHLALGILDQTALLAHAAVGRHLHLLPDAAQIRLGTGHLVAQPIQQTLALPGVQQQQQDIQQQYHRQHPQCRLQLLPVLQIPGQAQATEVQQHDPDNAYAHSRFLSVHQKTGQGRLDPGQSLVIPWQTKISTNDDNYHTNRRINAMQPARSMQ